MGKKQRPANLNDFSYREKAAAWKYVGYPGLSNFMASSTDCFVLRRFSTLNVRVLLKLQNDILELERKLDDLDEYTMIPDHGGGCGSFRLDANTPRSEVLENIATALKDYNSRVVEFLSLQDRPTAGADHMRNIRNWFSSYPNVIENKEQEFLDFGRDLLSVRTERRTHFGKWMESAGFSWMASLRGQAIDQATKYYDRNAWKSVGAFLLLLCAIMMLLGPMWSLAFATEHITRFALVSAFTIAFSILVVVGTTLKASQRVVLLAGYFAQLILILGLNPASNNHSPSKFPTTTTIPTPATVTSSVVFTATVTSVASVPAPPCSTTATTAFAQSASSNSEVTAVPIEGLSIGAIAGIGVGVAIGAICLMLVGFLCYRHRRSSRRCPSYQCSSYCQSGETINGTVELNGERKPVELDAVPKERQPASNINDAGTASSAAPSTAKGKGRVLDANTAEISASNGRSYLRNLKKPKECASRSSYTATLSGTTIATNTPVSR